MLHFDSCSQRVPVHANSFCATPDTTSKPGSVDVCHPPSNVTWQPTVAFLRSRWQRRARHKDVAPCSSPKSDSTQHALWLGRCDVAGRFSRSRWRRERTEEEPTPGPKGESDSTSQRGSWLDECLQSLPRSLPPTVKSIAFPYSATPAKKGSEQAAYRSALRTFAEANPQLRVLAVDSCEQHNLSLKREHLRRNLRESKVRREALRPHLEAEDAFSQMLSSALVDELESVAQGDSAPSFAASVLVASCVARGISPSTDCKAPDSPEMTTEEGGGCTSSSPLREGSDAPLPVLVAPEPFENSTPYLSTGISLGNSLSSSQQNSTGNREGLAALAAAALHSYAPQQESASTTSAAVRLCL